MNSERTIPVSSELPSYPDGSRWMHCWIEPMPRSQYVALGYQYEHVGVRITEAPALLLPPAVAREVIAAYATCPGAVVGDDRVSIPIGDK